MLDPIRYLSSLKFLSTELLHQESVRLCNEIVKERRPFPETMIKTMQTKVDLIDTIIVERSK